MQHIESGLQEDVYVIALARGKANALHSETIDELLAAVNEARSLDAARSLVLASARPRFFSAGFDAGEVFQYGREEMTEFFGRFIGLFEALLHFPKPVVAAVSGHAYAGGAVLALAADARVMAEGDSRFALNEVNLGVVITPGMMRAVVAAGGLRTARRLVLEGEPLTAAQALEVGIADELAPEREVLSRAMARARDLAAKPPEAFAAIKRILHAEAGHPEHGADRTALAGFVEHWFSRESTARREELTRSIRR
jgi:enoyl-CoA hydratase/carnithine racemase